MLILRLIAGYSIAVAVTLAGLGIASMWFVGLI